MADEKKAARPRAVPPMPQPTEVQIMMRFPEGTTSRQVLDGWITAAFQAKVKRPRGGGQAYREIRIRDLELQALEVLLAEEKRTETFGGSQTPAGK